MASKIEEIAVSFVLGAVKSVGQAEIGDLLDKFKELNPPEDYENLLKGLHGNFSLLAKLAIKTKTKVDDGLIDFVLQAIEDAAEENNIQL